MPRFFIDPSFINIENNTVIISGNEYKHITKVLRMGVNDPVELCDSKGTVYQCVIDRINADHLQAGILSSRKEDTEPSVKVTLFQAVPKSDKMELIIQKCVELGITEIVPVFTERVIVKVNSEQDRKKKLERWNKIAYEAAKQSGRGKIPVVKEFLAFGQALESLDGYDLKLIPYEMETEASIGHVLKKNNHVKNIAYCIGPEGGFTFKEIAAARDAGVEPITLGKRILRTETCGFAVLTIIMYEMGDLK